MNKLFFTLLVACAFHTQALAVGTPLLGKRAVNSLPVGAQRLISCLTPKEFSALTGQKMGFFNRLGYNKLRKRCARELAVRGLQNEYDTLYLTDGGVELVYLLSQDEGRFVYKKKGESGLRTIVAEQVGHWGRSQSLLLDSTKSVKLPFEKDATKAMWFGLGAIGAIAIPFAASGFGLIALGLLGIIYGTRALKKIRKSEGTLRGKARAWVGIVIGVLLLAAVFVVLATSLRSL
jgi:hypothetical protein